MKVSRMTMVDIFSDDESDEYVHERKLVRKVIARAVEDALGCTGSRECRKTSREKLTSEAGVWLRSTSVALGSLRWWLMLIDCDCVKTQHAILRKMERLQ